MLSYIGDFRTAIKQPARDIGLNIGFVNDGSTIMLDKNDIQSLDYTSQAKKALGGIVRKVIDAKLIYNEDTSKLNKGDFVNLFYTCGTTGKCKIDIFYVSQLKRNTANTLITMEAVDLLTYLNTEKQPTLPMMKNTTLRAYVEAVLTSLGYSCSIGDVANPNLSLGYPKSLLLQATLEEIGIAMQALIRFKCSDAFGLTLPFTLPGTLNQMVVDGTVKADVSPYKVKVTADETVNSYIEYTVDDDASDQYSDVKVNLFFPSAENQKSLGTAKTTVPASTTNYNIGTIEFGSTTVPEVGAFNCKATIADYTLGSDRCSLKLNNSAATAQVIETDFLGMDINESTITEQSTDSNCRQVSNIYIQASAVYDTRIYKNKNCTVRYFGNPLIEVGDTISIDDDKVLVVEHSIKYSGGLKGSIKGVVINE